MSGSADWDLYDVDELSGTERYDLLTSLVVPRPIGWLGTRSPGGADNLAPFSYFAALASSPMLVGVSIGHRASGPKDSLANIRGTRCFTVNVVDEAHLAAVNASSADVGPGVDEFGLAGLDKQEADAVPAPSVRSAAAVLECELFREVDLGTAPNTLIIGRVTAVRVRPELKRRAGSLAIDTEALRPVGRLWGADYGTVGEILTLPRPRA
ncbi:MAG: flavin reductase family protein [Gemmatimonadota bacterium]|nr:flavin reductase family protein [Gemmatimonadota bacterium]